MANKGKYLDVRVICPYYRKDKIKAEYLKELSELSLDDLVKKVYGISLKERENNNTKRM